jgi:RNA polymerase sigma factor (sigma-70 family)
MHSCQILKSVAPNLLQINYRIYNFFPFQDVTICNFTGNQCRRTIKLKVAETTDEILMENVKSGNLSGMSVLFERYHLRVYNFFFRLTYDMDVSNDLTQNLFYRMIKYKNSYKNEYSVKSWIFQIARNLHTDFCNEEKRSGELFLKTDKYYVEPSDDTEGYQEDDYVRLEKAMSNLSVEQKEIIVLSRYQGMKYEEISEITKQSVGAIKVAMYRAIKQLRGIYFKQI